MTLGEGDVLEKLKLQQVKYDRWASLRIAMSHCLLYSRKMVMIIETQSTGQVQ